MTNPKYILRFGKENIRDIQIVLKPSIETTEHIDPITKKNRKYLYESIYAMVNEKGIYVNRELMLDYSTEETEFHPYCSTEDHDSDENHCNKIDIYIYNNTLNIVYRYFEYYMGYENYTPETTPDDYKDQLKDIISHLVIPMNRVESIETNVNM